MEVDDAVATRDGADALKAVNARFRSDVESRVAPLIRQGICVNSCGSIVENRVAFLHIPVGNTANGITISIWKCAYFCIVVIYL